MANAHPQRITGWLLVASLAGITGLAQSRSDADKKLPNPYQTIAQHFKMPTGRTLGSSSSVDIDTDGTSVWIADRCAAGSCLNSNLAAVFKFDAAGNTVKNFGAGMFVYPHGIHMDRQGNVWVVDGQSNMPPRGRGARGAAAGTAPAPAPKVPVGRQPGPAVRPFQIREEVS